MIFGISKNSCLYSFYLHVGIFVFVVIPMNFMIPNHAEDSNDIALIAISAADYQRLIAKTPNEDTRQPAHPVRIYKSKIISPVVTVKNNNIAGEHSKQANKNTANNKHSVLTKKTALNAKPRNVIKDQKILNSTKLKIENVNSNIQSISSSNLSDIVNQADDIAPTLNAHLSEDVTMSSNGLFSNNSNSTVKEVDVAYKPSTRDIISVQIAQCWSEFHSDAELAKDITITAFVSYERDGKVSGISIKGQFFIDSNMQSVYRDMSHRATLAIKHCSPLKGLPPETFSEWRRMQFNLRQKQ